MFLKNTLVQNLHPFVTRGKYDHHNDVNRAFVNYFLLLSEAKNCKESLPSSNALK